MIEKGNILTLEDNNEYTVVSKINFNNVDYFYLIDQNNVTNIMFCTLENDEVVEINDPDLLEELILKFDKDLKETLD